MPPDGHMHYQRQAFAQTDFSKAGPSARPQAADASSTAGPETAPKRAAPGTQDFKPLAFKTISRAEAEGTPEGESATPSGNPIPSLGRKTPPLFGLAAKLATIMHDLTAIIAQETGLLKSQKPREAQSLHGTKNRLIVEYKDIIGRLKVNQDSLGDKGSKARTFLRELGEKLKDTLKDHARVVIRMKSMSEGLIKSIGEEVAKKTGPVLGYGKTARMAAPPATMPPSLALNELI